MRQTSGFTAPVTDVSTVIASRYPSMPFPASARPTPSVSSSESEVCVPQPIEACPRQSAVRPPADSARTRKVRERQVRPVSS